MTNYKSLLIESRKEKIQESVDKTGLSISKTASKNSVKIYKQQLRKCRGTLFKKMEEDEQKKCVLKAMRSYCKAFLSSLKDNYSKCDKSDKPVACTYYLQALAREYGARINKINSQLGE